MMASKDVTISFRPAGIASLAGEQMKTCPNVR